MSGDDNPLPGGGSRAPGTAGLGSLMRYGARQARHQLMRPARVKHGLMHAPSIAHSHNGTGTSPPNFGGSYSPKGF